MPKLQSSYRHHHSRTYHNRISHLPHIRNMQTNSRTVALNMSVRRVNLSSSDNTVRFDNIHDSTNSRPQCIRCWIMHTRKNKHRIPDASSAVVAGIHIDLSSVPTRNKHTVWHETRVRSEETHLSCIIVHSATIFAMPQPPLKRSQISRGIPNSEILRIV